jgi:hypothetical protein
MKALVPARLTMRRVQLTTAHHRTRPAMRPRVSLTAPWMVALEIQDPPMEMNLGRMLEAEIQVDQTLVSQWRLTADGLRPIA